MAPSNKTLLVIGSGPGIGRAVTTILASKRYDHVVLISRRADQLKIEEEAVKAAVGSHVKVKTFPVDITDADALNEALDAADAEFGKPEFVFHNAARVMPSELLSFEVKEIEYDMKIAISALYIAAQRYIPHLVEFAKTDKSAYPAFVVTSSMLPQQPLPSHFALSASKAAQRTLVQCLNMTYGSEGVIVGLINVGGQVSPEHATWNPANIAAKTWEWVATHKENPAFEVVI